jgi:hypothetical protein
MKTHSLLCVCSEMLCQRRRHVFILEQKWKGKFVNAVLALLPCQQCVSGQSYLMRLLVLAWFWWRRLGVGRGRVLLFGLGWVELWLWFFAYWCQNISLLKRRKTTSANCSKVSSAVYSALNLGFLRISGHISSRFRSSLPLNGAELWVRTTSLLSLLQT